MTNDLRRTLIFCLASSLFFAACGGGLPYPGLTADEVYALGLQAREQEDWEDAAEAFEYVLFSPGFSSGAQARLLLAEVQYSNQLYIESRSEYQRVIDRWPADTVAVRAALGVCRSLASLSPITQRDQGFTRQARLSCRQVAGDFAGTLMGLEAERLADEMMLKLAEQDYDTGRHYLRRGLLDSALLYFETVASEYPDTEWAPWALYRMIEVFGRIGYLRDVETTQDLLLDAYADSEPAQLLLEDGGV
jgi:outer membrane protein assembly factor BamD